MTSPPVVAPIVEGHGEVAAVRELVTRIGLELLDGTWIEVAQPFRLDSGRMRKPEELVKAIRFQAQRIPRQGGGILVLRDGDDSDITCPVTLAYALKQEQESISVPTEVVIAWREYEAWFLAAVDSLRPHPAVSDNARIPADPEGKRNAKLELERLTMESYRETLHQAKFSALIDLKMARANSRSFRRMVHAVTMLAGR